MYFMDGFKAPSREYSREDTATKYKRQTWPWRQCDVENAGRSSGKMWEFLTLGFCDGSAMWVRSGPIAVSYAIASNWVLYLEKCGWDILEIPMNAFLFITKLPHMNFADLQPFQGWYQDDLVKSNSIQILCDMTTDGGGCDP